MASHLEAQELALQAQLYQQVYNPLNNLEQIFADVFSSLSGPVNPIVSPSEVIFEPQPPRLPSSIYSFGLICHIECLNFDCVQKCVECDKDACKETATPVMLYSSNQPAEKEMDESDDMIETGTLSDDANAELDTSSKDTKSADLIAGNNKGEIGEDTVEVSTEVIVAEIEVAEEGLPTAVPTTEQPQMAVDQQPKISLFNPRISRIRTTPQPTTT